LQIIVISGAHSRIGKTSLAEDLLRSLPDWSALKVTVKKQADCPRNSNCVVCGGFKKDFEMVTNRKIINQRGTDTARLKSAGAKKVIWLKSTLRGLKIGLKKALGLLEDSRGVIIEGTSVLRYIRPDFAIYLNDEIASLRTAAEEARKKANIVINVNR
jgi:molybdopterin-guanine dinucleotide biosynthesis protein